MNFSHSIQEELIESGALMNNYPDFSSYGYEVIRELGRNQSLGRVTYLAKVKNEAKEVVIKQFNFAVDNSIWKSFKAYEREIQMLQDLEHPRIPRYLNSFQLSSGFCLVTEYKDAPCLAEIYSLNPDKIKQIAISILEILVDLQYRIPPVIHRDIKPENILLDEDMNVYLIDFGVAALFFDNEGSSSLNHATPGFMAPEQMFNRSLTLASDLYSVGATIICLLTGTASSNINSLLDENYCFQFQDRVAYLNPRFVRWLEKMVALSAKERYPNAAAALKALQPIAVTGSGTILDRLSRISATARKPILGLTIAFLVLLGIVGVNWIVLWFMSPVRQLQQTKTCVGCNLYQAELIRGNLAKANLERTNLEKANLTEANLGEANLAGAYLREANLEGAYLKKTSLQNSVLDRALLTNGYLEMVNLMDTSLVNANLSNANLMYANLERANLAGANLTDANLIGVNLTDASLIGANLKGTAISNSTQMSDRDRVIWRIVNQGGEGANLQDFNLARSHLERVKLNQANLQGANLAGAILKGSSLKGANLSNANLAGANLEDVDLTNANLMGANLIGANLNNANLAGAYLKDTQIAQDSQIGDRWRLVWEILNQQGEGANLEGVNLAGANLKGANLEAAYLKNATLDNATLENANLTGANLMNANLQQATLKEAKLIGATLKGANLTNANLEAANLYIANLRDANIQGTNLKDANVQGAILPGRESDNSSDKSDESDESDEFDESDESDESTSN